MHQWLTAALLAVSLTGVSPALAAPAAPAAQRTDSVRIQAEDFTAGRIDRARNATRSVRLGRGDWVRYAGTAAITGFRAVRIRVVSRSRGCVEVRSGTPRGRRLARVPVVATGGAWRTAAAVVPTGTVGRLALVFRSPVKSAAVSVDWFELSSPVTPAAPASRTRAPRRPTPAPKPTPTPTPKPPPTPKPTATPTPSPTRTPTPTPSPSPTRSATPSPTPTSSATPTPTPTPTVTPTPSATPTPTPTPTVTPTSTPTPTATPPALAPGAFAFDSDSTGNYELYTMAKGQAATRLTTDPRFDSWSPRLSPDRRTLLFYRTPAGIHDRDYQQTSLWRVGVDGSDLRELRPRGTDGWELQGHAEWSPDGQRLVMFGGVRMNPQLFVTDATGQHPVQLTNRPGVNLDPAYTADGSGVYFVGCPQAECYEADYEIYRLDLAGGPAARLTFDQLRDHDPYASPQGDRVAWLTQFATTGIGVWDVTVAAADGTGARRLMGDDGVTSRPQWSADGKSVLVHRIPPAGGRWDVYEVSADGAQVTVLTSGHPGSNEYPTW